MQRQFKKSECRSTHILDVLTYLYIYDNVLKTGLLLFSMACNIDQYLGKRIKFTFIEHRTYSNKLFVLYS